MTKTQMVRTRTPMSAFTFYLDDNTKLELLIKLRDLGLDGKKGTMAATIRVLLNKFANGDFDELIKDINKAIEAEYLFTTTKNKRSSL